MATVSVIDTIASNTGYAGNGTGFSALANPLGDFLQIADILLQLALHLVHRKIAQAGSIKLLLLLSL